MEVPEFLFNYINQAVVALIGSDMAVPHPLITDYSNLHGRAKDSNDRGFRNIQNFFNLIACAQNLNPRQRKCKGHTPANTLVQPVEKISYDANSTSRFKIIKRH